MVKLPQPVSAYNSHKKDKTYSSILLSSTSVPCDWLTVLPTVTVPVAFCCIRLTFQILLFHLYSR